jgi:ABC-type transport system involved in multi-copper enzyme maturation permease subunit
MSPATEVRLIAFREIRKNLRSAKGIVLFVLSILGGLAMALLLAKFAPPKLEITFADLPPEQREGLLKHFLGDEALADYIVFQAPIALREVFDKTVWLGPLLVSLMAFDAIPSELQYRTVRYWAGRSRRSSYFLGKLFGVWGVVSTVTFVMHALVWIVCISRGVAPVGTILGWGIHFWLATLPLSLIWCALATLVSSQLKSPPLALIVIFAVFFLLWLASMLAPLPWFESVKWIAWAYPNSFDVWLMHPHVDRAAATLFVCMACAAFYAAIGATLFARRDV